MQRVADAATQIHSRSASGRLAPPFAYVPRGAVTTSASLAPLKASFLDLAQRLPRRSPQDLRAVGAAELLGGRVDEAIKMLQESAQGQNNANAWNDLATAHLAAYEQQQKPLALVDALAAADRALVIDSRHSAASFNRALILQRLGLLQEAIVAWHVALRIDATSPWALEATVALRELEAEVPSPSASKEVMKALEASAKQEALVARSVRLHPRLIRRACEAVYLGQWGEAKQRGDDATAADRLGLVRTIGDVLRSTSGERLLADSVRVIDDAKNDAARTRDLAEGAILYSAARKANLEQRFSEAEVKFRESARLLDRGGSPFAYLARYSVGSMLYAQQRTGEAEAMLDQLASQKFAERGYHALAGHIGWERGLAKLVRGAFSEARRILGGSRVEFALLGESEAVATMDEFIAETDDFAGDSEQAWTLRIAAFPALSRAGEAPRKVTAIDAASAAFIVRGEWERASAILSVASQSAVELHDPLRAAHAFTERSIASAEMGESARAETELAEARRWSSMLKDESQRRAMAERGLLTEALIARDPRQSVTILDRDISQVLSTDRSIFAGRLLLERARRHRTLGNLDEARADVGLAMTMLEGQRAAVTSVDGRALLARTAESLTEEAVMVAFDRNAPEDAFAAIERWRGRAVLDALERIDDRDGAAARPLTLPEISGALGARAAVVEYALVSDRIIAFVIRHNGASFVEWRVDASKVHSLVAAVSAAVRKPEPDRSLADAYTMFVAPLTGALTGTDVVAFVPDPRMQLPFGALYDAGLRQSVGDRFATVVAPSATLAIRCSSAARARTGTSVAAIAGDAFDSNAAPGLQTLAYAAAESRSVSRMYSNRTLLSGAGATKGAVARIVPTANVIHFAGHAASTGSRAADSVLFIAPDHDSGIVTAAEVAHWNLQRSRLVFLSACRTGKPGATGDGVENLATAFIIAGAPAVIAASWDLDDQSAAGAAIRFHRSFSAGENVAESLRHVSIDPTRPQWPPMTIFGGLSELVERKGE